MSKLQDLFGVFQEEINTEYVRVLRHYKFNQTNH